MLIRGIDFARHNIVVGSDAESAVPANATTNNQPRGDVVARVVAASGAEAILDMGGQRVVVETHVALNAGDKLWVRVFDGPNGSLRLAVQSSGPEDGLLPLLPETSIDDMLRDLNLPTDPRTRAAAYALIARDGTLNQQDLSRLVGDLRRFPQVSQRQAGAAALLQKAQAPITEATVGAVLERAEPEAPPQLGQRLMALAPALPQLKRLVRGPAATLVDELSSLLKGLPLDERAKPGQVSNALRQWLAKLQPDQGAAPQASQASSTPPRPPAAGSPPSAAEPESLAQQFLPREGEAEVGVTRPQADLMPPPPDGTSPQMGEETLLTAPQAAGGQAAVEAEALPLPAGAPKPDTPQNAASSTPAAASAATPAPAKQAAARAPVSASQHPMANTGITRVAQPSRDLASLLTRVDQNLGAEHKELHKLLKEAIAEVRYTQLTNASPPQHTPEPQEFYVPLLLPQLSPDQPEGRLQVYYKPSRPNEPIDPSNTRLVLVVDTEHLGTVQTDVTIKDGTVDLNLGVPNGTDRNFLAEHLQELEKAIASLGWPTGRFGAHVAKKPPPKTHQQEGLSDIVRFDRRV